MVKAKRARTAETPKPPSLCLRSRAPYFYPDWLQLSVREPSRRSGWHREVPAQVTLNDRCKTAGCNTSEPVSASSYEDACEPTVSSAREGCQKAGINGHVNRLRAPGCWGLHAVKVSRPQAGRSHAMPTGHGQLRRIRATEVDAGRMRIPRGS